jgi:PBP1b-binding outer membrane lipoprotein LpoB
MRTSAFARAAIIAVAMTLSGCSSGCIAVGGTDNTTQPTLGKQLCDLKVARDTGAIGDNEYADAKTKLLNGEYQRKH